MPACQACGQHAEKHCGKCRQVFYCAAECQRTDWPVHKGTCKKPGEALAGDWVRPPVLLIVAGGRAAFDGLYVDTKVLLKRRAALTTIASPDELRTVLAEERGRPRHRFHAAILADARLVNETDVDALEGLREWAAAGGALYLGFSLPSFCNSDQFELLFRTLGVPHWRRGGYHRTVYGPDAAALGALAARLPRAYSMKAQEVDGVHPREQVYVTGADAHTQSHVFAPRRVGAVPGTCAIARAQIGRGSVIYAGDVNNEADTMAAMMVLLGLAPVPEDELQNRPVMPTGFSWSRETQTATPTYGATSSI